MLFSKFTPNGSKALFFAIRNSYSLVLAESSAQQKGMWRKMKMALRQNSDAANAVRFLFASFLILGGQYCLLINVRGNDSVIFSYIGGRCAIQMPSKTK